MYKSTKIFDNFSVALRQHKAAHSHCQLLHGYALEFNVVFEAETLDEMNWVVDFGCFSKNGFKDWMNQMFDHTTLIEKDDKYLPLFEEMNTMRIIDLRVMDSMGCESLAKLVFDKLQQLMASSEGGRVNVFSVECKENNKNSGIYTK
jgi:6-pyruvoyltetrahydropterin/6-carboxytetrahydropterin synthase